ncbi:MAG: hypothetical protein U0797_30335 [Gemmataceae bacterium]
MAGRSRHDADAQLAAALARGERVEDAARLAGVSARTAFRRLKGDPGFRAMVAEARSQMVRRVAGRLADAGERAVGTLVGLLDGEDLRVGLGAPARSSNTCSRRRSWSSCEERVRDLERAIREGRPSCRPWRG